MISIPFEVQNAVINTDPEPTYLVQLIKEETDEDIIEASWSWNDDQLVSFKALTRDSILILLHNEQWSYLARFDRTS